MRPFGFDVIFGSYPVNDAAAAPDQDAIATLVAVSSAVATNETFRSSPTDV